MTKFLLFIFILLSLSVYGQSEILKGKIIADSLQGYAINIVNFTKKTGTTNDENGFFEIPANPGDSIVFSSVQYQIRSIIVHKNQFLENGFTVVLTPVIQQLDQVKVSNVELSGYLDADLKTLDLSPFVDNQILGLPFSDKPQPTLAQRRIYTARSGILDLPINYLNGKLKKLKKIKAIDDLNKIVQKGETTFDPSFFINELKLPENLIPDFMYYCAKDDYFKNRIENSNKLTLVEFFQKKVISYKKHKELD
ncbi:hypothetical protein [Aquimarina muelleri]|uniref:CarboxypepD_reg-like domain-containing protein n=1 Tax=Aquimarina muelleri TaxID=279356 RepID=A0A918JWT9_9FLAO|nr:hypothetical protein [Aquimarina muelleri]MCX2764575.1 carboxypeptidase-like regulatory domain-containing protein [Aquimarina muelleri]GGX21539.1 hypothetical protein GCM10007384_23480 [Aquimarina muelleri]